MTDEQLKQLALGAREAWDEANRLIPHLGPTEPVIYLGHHEWLQTMMSVHGQSLVRPGRSPDETTIMGVACVRVQNASYQHLTWRPVK